MMQSRAGHADVGLLNNYLSVLPGVDFSPQFVRYAFSTYGERDLGFHKSEAKIILDHMEDAMGRRRGYCIHRR